MPEGCALFGRQCTDFLGQRDDTLVIKLVIQGIFPEGFNIDGCAINIRIARGLEFEFGIRPEKEH
ncbi:hypothetical protein D3C75_1225450 [compost metagenome]